MKKGTALFMIGENQKAYIRSDRSGINGLHQYLWGIPCAMFPSEPKHRWLEVESVLAFYHEYVKDNPKSKVAKRNLDQISLGFEKAKRKMRTNIGQQS